MEGDELISQLGKAPDVVFGRCWGDGEPTPHECEGSTKLPALLFSR